MKKTWIYLVAFLIAAGNVNFILADVRQSGSRKSGGGSGGGVTFPFSDASFSVDDDGDGNTLSFQLSGLTGNRIATWPNSALTVAGIDLAQTWTASQLTGNGVFWFYGTAATNAHNKVGFANVNTPDTSGLWTGTTANSWLIAEAQDSDFDFAHALQPNPTLFIHSANQSTTEYGSLSHNGTNFVIHNGKTLGALLLTSLDSGGKIFFDDGNGWIQRTAASNGMQFAPSSNTAALSLTATILTAMPGGTTGNIRCLNPAGSEGTCNIHPSDRGANTLGGHNLIVRAGAGSTATTGDVGGDLSLLGGDAGGSGNNRGGDVTLGGGAPTGTGLAGTVVVGKHTVGDGTTKTVDAATTFAITSSYHVLACTGAETINTITGADRAGTILYLENTDTECTIADDDDATASNAIDLTGAGANDVGAVAKVIVLIYNGTFWKQVSESDN